MQISLNIIDILCLHIFFLIRSNSRITFIVFGGGGNINVKYTYFKLHDPAAHKYNSTLEYRRDLVKRQITLCSNMLKQKLHHFCNRSSPDDGSKSGRKY